MNQRLEIPTLAALHAELLAKLATGGDRALLRRIVESLGAARDEGHVCLDLVEWLEVARTAVIEPGGDTPTASDVGVALATLDLDGLRRELLSTGLVAAASLASTSAEAEATPVQAAPMLPLVLDPQHRLYALRHYLAEQRIAAFVRERLERPLTVTADTLRETLRSLDLLPKASPAQPAQPDWQLAAVVAGASRALTVLCGGPGTGKTTTVARLLSVLLQLDPELRIAVAAPTGKAAARLAEALAERAAAGAVRGEPLRPELQRAMTQLEPRTLHRLLGYLPQDDAFRYGRARRLPYDVVVVDEVSMVDPAIFAVLCEAMPDRARLVLVGDKDQLAAIAAGQVLGDLTRAARPEHGLGPGLAAFVDASTGMQFASQPRAAPIADATVTLWTNHRFGQYPGIGSFAEALMQRRPDAAFAAVTAGHDDLLFEHDLDAALLAIEPMLLRQLDAAASGDAEQALAAVQQARILTAQRHGPTGAIEWNRRVERRLAALARLRSDDPSYVGRPVLVTQNDQQNRVWNGDLGVVGRDRRGAPVVWMRDPHGRPRELNPRRLPAHETAWAMTVHKAQGSEFDHVLLVLPDRDGPLLQASLIYTGVTRARRRAWVCADPALLRLGLARWPQRRSGLADALRG